MFFQFEDIIAFKVICAFFTNWTKYIEIKH